MLYTQAAFVKSETRLRMRTLLLIVFLSCALLITSCNRSNISKTGSKTRVYVTNEASGELSVIDAGNNTVITTLPIGKRPRGIQISPDRKTAFIALSGSPFAGPGVDESKLPPADKTSDGIGLVDVQRNQLIKVLPGGSDPEQFAITPDGRTLYVANEDAGLASVVDIASGAILKSLPVGEEPEGVAIRPDGGVVYVTSESKSTVYVIDTSKQEIVTSFKVGRRPRAIAFLPDGSRAYVTSENESIISVVDAQKHVVLHTIPVPGEGVKLMGIVVSPDAKRLYVTSGRFRRVFAIDTATDQIVGSVEVGERPWGIAITPDGKTLYTANGPSNDVSIVDVATLSVVGRIKVGDRPWGVAILP